MRSVIPALAAISLVACGDQSLGEDWEDWFDSGSTYEVTEPVAFTEEAYGLPVDGDRGIAGLIADVFDGDTFSNLGPFFPPGTSGQPNPPDNEEDLEDIFGCAFWVELPEPPEPEEGEAREPPILPRTITAVVTSHPRVYKKIEGCDGDEKYYGSYWIEDDHGALFVLGDSKVAHFDMGDTVTLNVRSMRRRYDINIVYVHDVVEVDRAVRPIHYDPITSPLRVSDQSTTVRASGVVVTEPTTFGEVLVQIDGYAPVCSPEDERTRANCLFVTIDQETSRRGVSVHVGDHIQVTGPVSQSAWFGPTGVFNFYGIYVMRVGQLTWLDGSR